MKSQGWGLPALGSVCLQSLGCFHFTGLNETGALPLVNKHMTSAPRWPFAGHLSSDDISRKKFLCFIFLWNSLSWQALSCLPFSGQLQSGPVAPGAGIFSQTPYHLTTLLPVSSLQFLLCQMLQKTDPLYWISRPRFPDRGRMRSKIFFLFHQLYFLWMDIFLEPVEKEGGEKPTPKQTTLWSKTEYAGVFTSIRMDSMSTVATTELVWIESECNLSERRPVCRAGSGVRGSGWLQKSQGTLQQASDS